MAGLQVLSAPTNQPTLTGVVSKPAGVPTGPLPVVSKPANVPAKLPVVSQPANVQPKLSVQPLGPQPTIAVPPKPAAAPQMDKIAADIGVARGRGADDTTILYTLLQKNPALVEPVKVAIKERGASPSQVLDTIIQKHQSTEKQPGLGQRIVQGIASPFLRAATNVLGIGAGVKNLAEAGVAKLKGDQEGYQKNLNEGGYALRSEPRDFGYLGKVKPIEKPLDAVGVGAELASNFIGGGGAKNVTTSILKQGFKEATKTGLKEGVKVGLTGGLGRALQNENPTVGQVAKDTAIETAAGGLFGLITGAGGYGIKAGVQKTLGALSSKVNESNLTTSFKQVVENGFNKGVKPAVNSGASKKAVEAVATIIDNKDALQLSDEAGNLVSRLPKNNQEFAQAIGQTKKNLFQRYNFFNKAAGSTGAKIELNPVASKIEQVINTPEIRDVRPDVYNYGKKIAETLRQRGAYSLEDSQDVIAALNSDAQGFFKTLNQADKPKGALAATIAETLRNKQAQVIESLTGAGADWVNLRRQYGALEAVEKDVVHRSLIQARRGPVSIFDLFQAANAGDVARVMVGDFSGAAKGLVSGTITKGLQMMNDPDRIVAKMFKDAAKHGDDLTKLNGSILPKVRPAIPSQKALPAPKPGALKSQVNVPINQPSKIIQPGTTPFKGKGALSRINDVLNEAVPGLYTTSKYTVTYTDKDGKQAVLKNLDRKDARGWLQWLEENGLKYSVKAAGVAGIAYAAKTGSNR